MRETNPAPATRPAAQPGDLWALGPHRIVCGDATDPSVVGLALGGARPNLMVTDPPYGVSYDPSWRAKIGHGARSLGVVANDDQADWREAWALFPGDVAYVWHGGLHASAVQDSLRAVGLLTRAQIIWRKHRIVISRGAYHWQHEACWYTVRKGRTANWTGDRKQRSVWDIKPAQDEGRTGHATQKPLECMRRPMLNHSRPGDLVYDPFLGSGSTLIAAEQLGRVCIGIELMPAYIDMAVERWERMTGQRAERLVAGEPSRANCPEGSDAALHPDGPVLGWRVPAPRRIREGGARANGVPGRRDPLPQARGGSSGAAHVRAARSGPARA